MTPGQKAGGPSVRTIPEGEDRERLVCPDCGYIAYENPKIVVGSVTTWEDGRILLCRRAIEPRRGFWTLPAGYMELGEASAAGAAREAWEEARARIEIDCLLAVYDIPRISQVQLIYRARLLSPEIGPGPESVEVGLFAWDDIPWGQLAFPSVVWSLNEHRARLGQRDFPPGGNPPDPVHGL
ncbi:NUDIX hydrolase [Rhodocista pekingensis]|uniref:NUDIX domain-containing protein n=1 Tax=Rhodocista pekingensis TaxID=201185 RepID=A0ABW2KTR7_9PROT